MAWRHKWENWRTTAEEFDSLRLFWDLPAHLYLSKFLRIFFFREAFSSCLMWVPPLHVKRTTWAFESEQLHCVFHALTWHETEIHQIVPCKCSMSFITIKTRNIHNIIKVHKAIWSNLDWPSDRSHVPNKVSFSTSNHKLPKHILQQLAEWD